MRFFFFIRGFFFFNCYFSHIYIDTQQQQHKLWDKKGILTFFGTHKEIK